MIISEKNSTVSKTGMKAGISSLITATFTPASAASTAGLAAMANVFKKTDTKPISASPRNPIKGFPPLLRRKHYMILTVPFRV